LSGGVIQITKNFKNFGEMTGDEDRDLNFSSLLLIRQQIEIFIYYFQKTKDV